MELELKKIIASFLQVDSSTINHSTIINKKSIPGSILIHRMYAQIEKDLGLKIVSFQKINKFSDLITYCKDATDVSVERPKPSQLQMKNGLGCDIENIKNFPECDDYRKDPFYVNNFSQSEISYCLTKKIPQESFAGLFAAKEALVKMHNDYQNIPFSQIEIEHDEFGKPYHLGISISISHNENNAIAIASITKNADIEENNNTDDLIENQTKFSENTGHWHWAYFFILVLPLLGFLSLAMYFIKDNIWTK